MVKFNMKPWDVATVTENTTPVRLGDRVTATLIDYVTGKPITNLSNYGKVYEVKEENGKLGIEDWSDPDDWFYKKFTPFSEFAWTIEFTIIRD